MFYNTENTQGHFEFLVVIAFLINLFVFFVFTFKPSALKSISKWATGIVERLWNGIFHVTKQQ
jgi:hypothetical protein